MDNSKEELYRDIDYWYEHTLELVKNLGTVNSEKDILLIRNAFINRVNSN